MVESVFFPTPNMMKINYSPPTISFDLIAIYKKLMTHLMAK
jgi:hypothetical protein